MDNPRIARALEELGLEASEIDRFLRGERIVYRLTTQGDPGIAMIERVGGRLRSGVIEINDPGGGRKDFMRFRDRSLVVAIESGAFELELFAAAVINPRIEELLIRRGYLSSEAAVPDDLGGGRMSILTKTQAVRRPGG